MRTALPLLSLLLLSLSTLAAAQAGTDPSLVRADASRCLADAEGRADVSCTVLYAYLERPLGLGLLNTIRPDDAYPDLRLGPESPTVEPYYDLNSVVLAPAPSALDLITVDARDIGLADPLDLASDVPVRAYWYLSADQTSDQLPDDGLGGGALPCLTVRTALATGRVFTPEDVFAEGTTTLSMVSPGASAPAGTTTPCGPGQTDAPIVVADVVEVEVVLGPVKIPSIAPTDGFVVLVEWWQHDAEDGRAYSGDAVRFHTGARYPDRLVLPSLATVRVVDSGVIDQDRQTFFWLAANTAFGAYDIDAANVTVRAFDGTGAEVQLRHVGAPIGRFDVSGTGGPSPVNITIPWDHTAEGLPPGPYRIDVTVYDRQRSGSAVRSFEVVLGGADAHDAGPPLVALLIAAVLFVLSRSRRPLS